MLIHESFIYKQCLVYMGIAGPLAIYNSITLSPAEVPTQSLENNYAFSLKAPICDLIVFYVNVQCGQC